MVYHSVTYALKKKRTLEKAGFVHVAGWVTARDAEAIRKTIIATLPETQKAIENDRLKLPVQKS